MRFLFLFALIAGLMGCSNNGTSSNSDKPKKPTTQEEVPDNPPQPDIALETVSKDGCLNLQLLSEAINKEEFRFPALVNTYQFANSSFNTLLFIGNFGVREIEFYSLPYLRGVVQKNCQELSSQTSYGRNIQFQVVDFQPNSLYIVRKEEQEEETNETIRSAIEEEVVIKSLRYTLTNKNSLRIEIESQMIFPKCSLEKKLPYLKISNYYWSHHQKDLPKEIEIYSETLRRAKNLFEISPMHLLEESSEEEPNESEEDEFPPTEGPILVSLEEVRRIESGLATVKVEHPCEAF